MTAFMHFLQHLKIKRSTFPTYKFRSLKTWPNYLNRSLMNAKSQHFITLRCIYLFLEEMKIWGLFCRDPCLFARKRFMFVCRYENSDIFEALLQDTFPPNFLVIKSQLGFGVTNELVSSRITTIDTNHLICQLCTS